MNQRYGFTFTHTTYRDLIRLLIQYRRESLNLRALKYPSLARAWSIVLEFVIGPASGQYISSSFQ